MPTRSSSSMAARSALTRGQRRTWSGARPTFCSAVRWGKRLKDWKTIPTSLRTASTLRMSSLSSIPSTTTRPRLCRSRRLMQRIIVDLPEPEGPATTTPSPDRIARLIPRRTCSLPNHLCTLSSRMMCWPSRAALVPAGWVAVALWVVSIGPILLPFSQPQPLLQDAAAVRHQVGEDEVADQQEDVDLLRVLQVPVDRQQRPAGPHQVAQADDHGEGRVLEEADELPHQRRDHVLHRLRQDDETHRLHGGEPHRPGRFRLPAGYRLDAGADDLPHIGGGEDDQADHRALHPAESAARHERHEDEEPQEYRD